MVDLARVVGFDWDSGNVAKSADKHRVGRAEAEQVFFNAPLLVVPDLAHSASETRFHALGTTDAERRLHITFTLRQSETLIRVISARDMSAKEGLIYVQSS